MSSFINIPYFKGQNKEILFKTNYLIDFYGNSSKSVRRLSGVWHILYQTFEPV